MSTLSVLGVRHHSPACARLVAETIATLRPAYVLVEGPAEMNDRLDELRLAHELPVAVFSTYTDGPHRRSSWSPWCDYSPEWVALTAADTVGAEFRFIDLPAWHPAFHDRINRYADTDRRYHDLVQHLCAQFAVDNVDTLWDLLIESDPGDGLADRLNTYFDAGRGDAAAATSDTERETYMAASIKAALARAGDRPVLVVCGGFHRPALLAASATGPATAEWPEVPAGGTSYLVPFSFTRLDAFDGYQSGMPSPEYYQQLWDHGPGAAAHHVIQAVAGRLRHRRQLVSTADLVAANTMAQGLARLRGNPHPMRTDLLDGLVSALVGDALDRPAPWTGRGRLELGTHPVVVEMIAAVSGERVGRLHPTTPQPPLVHDVTAALARHHLDGHGSLRLDLTADGPRARSQILHRLRILAIPGFTRHNGPTPGGEPSLEEHWQLHPTTDDARLVALIEAGGWGATLTAAAAARLGSLRNTDPATLAGALFDAALAGIDELPGELLAAIPPAIATCTDLAALGQVLHTVLALWRHDRLLGLAHSPALATLIATAIPRALWLAEGIHGGPAPADQNRLSAVAAIRDAVRHTTTGSHRLETDQTQPSRTPAGADRDTALAVMGRIAVNPQAPPDLRGAAFGFTISFGVALDAARAVRAAAAPAILGDWLAGLFALARAEITGAELLKVLDELISAMTDTDFLIALPALRQAFNYFPPREPAEIATRLRASRALTGPPGRMLRLDTDPIAVARAHELESVVEALLIREGLG